MVIKIKDFFKGLAIRFGIKKAKKESSILKNFIDNPESVKLEAYIEGNEIIVKIKNKEKT